MCKNNILYHYCSAESFIKIICNNTIRFSDVTKSNDYNEVVLLWENYYDYVLANSNNLLASKSLRYLINQDLENDLFLSFSLSEAKDNCCMWMKYANEGVSIGFDKNELQKWADEIKIKQVLLSLKPITYQTDDELQSFIRNIAKNETFIMENAKPLVDVAPFLKTKQHEKEKETRLLLSTSVSYDQCDFSKYITYNYHFDYLPNRYNDNVLSCFIQYPKNIIKEVVLSPNCRLNESDITKLLYVNGFSMSEICICKSSLT